jgi:Zn-dependent peptidase ImmA (M78 family)
VLVRNLAKTIRRRQRVTGVPTEEEIDGILDHYNVRLFEWPMPGDLREVIIGDHLYLAVGLSREWRRWLKLHALGHFLCHEGNALHLESIGQDLLIVKRDRLADLLAGYVLLGDPKRLVRQHLAQGQDAVGFTEVAAIAEVPTICIERWWHLACGDTHPHRQERG